MGQVLARFCDHAAVCHARAIAHVFYEVAQGSQTPLPERKMQACFNPRPESDGLLHRASHDRLADVSILHEKDVIPEAWDVAVAQARRTFYDTANRYNRRFTVVFGEHAGVWRPSTQTRHLHFLGRVPSLSAHRRTSSPIFCSSARATLRRVRLPASRDAPVPPSPDDVKQKDRNENTSQRQQNVNPSQKSVFL